MKFNWGTGLIIAMVLFMVFIVSMVAYVSNKSVELVSENYYEQEINYEDRIVATSNGNEHKENITISNPNGNVFVHFNDEAISNEAKGEIHMYRANNKEMDVVVPFSNLKNNQIIIPNTDVQAGKYNVQISWQENDKNYYVAKSIVVEK